MSIATSSAASCTRTRPVWADRGSVVDGPSYLVGGPSCLPDWAFYGHKPQDRLLKIRSELSKPLVRDTGIEPVTSSVSGKRSPAELIAPGSTWRWRRESNPCARLCRPLPHHSATPPLGLMPMHLRADDGIRTRDPHLGKVMRYQLRYIRAPRTTRRPSRRTTIVHQSVAAQISAILAPGKVR